MHKSGWLIIKQDKGKALLKPPCRITAAGRADCNAVFGELRQRRQIMHSGVGFEVAVPKRLDDNGILVEVAVMGRRHFYRIIPYKNQNAIV